MDALKRLEELIESAVEGSLAEVLPGRLQPVEIAKKLARAMESGQTIAAGKTLAPNDYAVHVHPEDFAALDSFRQSLERELAAYLRATAAERGLSFVAPPLVAITADDSLRRRRMRISASLTDSTPAHAEVQAGEFTAQLPVAQVRAALQRQARLSLADGRAIRIDSPVVSLGRQLGNDIVIEDKRVSRRHAQIRYEHRSYCLYDLASANGTSVNGERVQQVVLRDGDLVSLGGFELTFHAAVRETKRGA